MLSLLAMHALLSATVSLVDPQTVSEWIEREWKAASTMPVMDGFSIRWRSEELEVPPLEEIEALRREVPRHPEHPRRGDLERYEQRLRGVPTRFSYELWSRGDERWRYNIDLPTGGYIDTVLTPTRPWRLSTKQLNLIDPAKVDSMDPSQMLTGKFREVLPSLGRLLSGGFQAGRISKITPGAVRVEGDRWTMVASRENPPTEKLHLVMEYTGRWDESVRRGFVDEAKILENGYNPRSVGVREVYSGWKLCSLSNWWIAERVDHIQPDGKLFRSAILEEVRAEPQGGFEAVITPPAFDGSDPVRGPSTFESILDWKGGTLQSKTETGAVGEPEPVPLPGPEGHNVATSGSRTAASGGGRLRTVGWVALGVGIAGVVWMKLRRAPRVTES